MEANSNNSSPVYTNPINLKFKILSKNMINYLIDYLYYHEMLPLLKLNKKLSEVAVIKVENLNKIVEENINLIYQKDKNFNIHNTYLNFEIEVMEKEIKELIFTELIRRLVKKLTIIVYSNTHTFKNFYFFEILSIKTSLEIVKINPKIFDSLFLSKLCKSLDSSHNKNIINLRISEMNLEFSDLQIISNFLKNNSSLKILQFPMTIIKDEGLKLIMDGLKFNKSISKLNLSETKISNVGLEIILNFFEENKTISELNLNHNNFNNIEATKLLGKLISQNNQIEIIDITYCKIDDENILPILEGLEKNNRIKKFSMHRNDLNREKSIDKIIKTLSKNSTLENLELSLTYKYDRNKEYLLILNSDAKLITEKSGNDKVKILLLGGCVIG